MKKIKTWHKVVLAIIVLAIIGNFLPQKEDVKNVATEIPWEQKNMEQKQKWLEAYFKNPDDAGYQLIALMDEEIKKQFNFPKEVEYKERPTFVRALVSQADSGWVFVKGSGTGKNAFGVKEGFKYKCRLTITPVKKVLEDVTVTFDN